MPLPAGPTATVLGWHRVDTDSGKIAVVPQVFYRQMEILSEHRTAVPVLTLEEARDHVAGGPGRLSPRRCVVLTFDDAWADNHANALPALSRHRLPATLYVPSRLLGSPAYMARSQVVEMARGGVFIGGHTRTHPDLRACNDAELESEIKGGKEDLEDMLGIPVTSFAYPTGLFDGRVVKAVAAAGYQTAITTRRGWWRAATSPMEIPRSFVEELPDSTFEAAAQGGLTALAPFESLKSALAPLLSR